MSRNIKELAADLEWTAKLLKKYVHAADNPHPSHYYEANKMIRLAKKLQRP